MKQLRKSYGVDKHSTCFIPLFFGKHTFKNLRSLRAGGKESQLFRSDCHKIISYWLTYYYFINNFARFTALLFPFLLCFTWLKSFSAFCLFQGNSAIRHWKLAWRVSGLVKKYFSNPRHPCGYGGISPLTLHSASRSLPYGKSTIKPSPDIE